MGLIGMTEAGRRIGITGPAARRALQRAEIPLVEINPRAFAVDEDRLEAFIKSRGSYSGMGRPKKLQAENSSGGSRL